MPEPGSDCDVVSPSDNSHDEVHDNQQATPRSHICQQLLPSVEHLIGSYRPNTDPGRFVHLHCSKDRSSQFKNSDARRKLYRVSFRGTSAERPRTLLGPTRRATNRSLCITTRQTERSTPAANWRPAVRQTTQRRRILTTNFRLARRRFRTILPTPYY